MDAITLEVGADGVAVATLDLPGKPMNLLDDVMATDLHALLERLESDADIKGLVLVSGKKDFFAGADVDGLWGLTTAQAAFDESMRFKRYLRRLERCGKPVVAAIHGQCLGGGLELAMSCHRRIVWDDGRARLGLPEVKLGLLPGGGGTQRLPRLVGMQQALQWMGEGSSVRADKALASGLVHELAPTREAMLDAARAWCVANPKPQQPWDAPKFRYPGGDSRSPAMAQLFSVAPALAGARDQGNYPAVRHILSSVFEGGLLGFDEALELESRYFAACVISPESRNLIGTLWYQLASIKRGLSRPSQAATAPVQRVGILGAGMMGAGIAHGAAQVGVEVVLLDTDRAGAERGAASVQALVNKALKRGHLSADKAQALMARVTPGVDHALLADCDLVIEAVFEDREVKATVTRSAEAQMPATAVFASNTSTLPITSLALASQRPVQFIGLHFFSPVDKMPLVEIIVGAQTSQATLARAFDFVVQIGKTPIVVNDSRGFFTSRVFGTYVMEGMAMLAEGVHPWAIERAGLKAGMPMPPLALQDEVSLSLALLVADQTRKDFAAEGRPYVAHPGEAVLRALCERGRTGRKAAQGFYDYADGDKRLWSGLQELFPARADQPTQSELIDRLLWIQANEAAKCLDEGVIGSVADANVGSILGWGFAPFHGGVLQFINTRGTQAFVDRARELADAHGARFAPATGAVAHAQAGSAYPQR